MTMQFYLTLPTIAGSSTSSAYRGAFEVDAFSLDTQSPVPGTVAAGAGKPDFGPLQVTLHDAAGLTQFLKLVSDGSHLTGASLIGVQNAGPTGSGLETYRVNLGGQVMITGVQESSDGSYVVTLDYSKIGIVTHAVQADGTLGPAQSFGYDIPQNTSIAPPSDVAPPTAVAPVQPTTFFAVIDGLNGGSQDVAHQGWFQLDGFNLNAANIVGTSGGGLAAGKVFYAPITLTLPSETALTDLMTKLCQGSTLNGVRIEGMSTGVGGAQLAVYDLSLSAVHITDVAQTESGGLSVTLSYGAIQLSTQGLDPSGNLTPASNFSWDIATTAIPPFSAIPGSGSDGSSSSPPAAPHGLLLDPSTDSAAAADHITNAHQLVVDGTAQANQTITLYDTDGHTILATGATNSAGGFSLTTSNLSEGSHAITAVAQASGLTSSSSAGLVVTVDSTAPDAPTSLADSAITGGYVNQASDTFNQALTGTAEAGATVSVYDGTTKLASVTADAGGAWSYGLGQLSDGPHSLTATATDAAGNTGAASTALTFNVDTAAPDAPTGVADASIVNGYVNAAQQAASALAGAAEAGATVTVYDGSTLLGTTTADSSGTWSYSVSALAEGAHSLTATATDAAGNTGGASGALSFKVDTAPPAAPAALADGSIVNGYVNAAQQAASALAGTAEAGATVSVYDGSTLLGTTTAGGGGAWTYGVSSLAEGAHSLTATATDAAGNTGAASSTLSFKVDTAPPAAPAALADGSIVNGYVDAAHRAASALAGTAEAGATDSVYDGSTLLGTTTASSGGAWTYGVSSLAEGPHSLTATATDAAGNTGAASGVLGFKVDTQVAAPSVSLVTDSGLAGDRVTNSGALTVGPESGAKVEYSVNGGSTWATSFAAVEGANTVAVRQTDLAGNVSAATTLSFTLDTKAPSAPTALGLDFSTDSGLPFDRVTNVNKVLINGKAEAGATVTLFDTNGTTVIGSGAADSSGAFHVTTTALSDGVHSISAGATDLAGNASPHSSTMNVTIDTFAPAPKITNIDSGAGGVAISGVSEPFTAVTIYDAGSLVKVAVAGADGTWTTQVNASGNTIHNYTLKAVDLAGNLGASTGSGL
ncbi:MAG: hypothetical protein JWQ97_944 [Phenylobacterium sp.]|nr:hypothetical protein [Phenylobacterium sp.]